MSALTDTMFWQIKAAGLPEPIQEHKFLDNRKFRFDLAWPDLKLAFEVEGGQYVYGRHNRPAGYQSDVIKYNLATLAGWRVRRATGGMVEDGTALGYLMIFFAR
jgi:hypothetical protein